MNKRSIQANMTTPAYCVTFSYVGDLGDVVKDRKVVFANSPQEAVDLMAEPRKDWVGYKAILVRELARAWQVGVDGKIVERHI